MPEKEQQSRARLIEEKTCLRCHHLKPLSDFYHNASRSDGYQNWCKSCQLEHQAIYLKSEKVRAHYAETARERTHSSGLYRPMSEAKDCGLYLGVCIAEKLLRNVFKNVEQMPHGNPGFDFICNKGKKIDVKSACRLSRQGHADTWAFHIDKNHIADYFLCIAFDDRASLRPEHLWLVPGDILCDKWVASIAENRLKKWSEFEKCISGTISCCEEMKASV